MTVSVGLIIGLGWLIVGIINISHHAHWAMILLDFVLGVFFLVMAVRKAIRAGDGENPGKKP